MPGLGSGRCSVRRQDKIHQKKKVLAAVGWSEAARIEAAPACAIQQKEKRIEGRVKDEGEDEAQSTDRVPFA